MSQPAETGYFPLCYGCGQENPIGFKLRVEVDNRHAWAQFTPGPYHTGWPDRIHGGVLCLLMDEVISYIPFLLFPGIRAVTGKMEARFRRPAQVGDTLLISAEIAEQRGKVVIIKSRITLQDGTTVADSESLVFLERKES